MFGIYINRVGEKAGTLPFRNSCIINQLNISTKMKKTIFSAKLFAAILMMGCTLGFTSCNDDDDKNGSSDVTPATLYGSYMGQLTTSEAATLDDEETPQGLAIEAVVKNDSVFFDKFPAKEILEAMNAEDELISSIIETIEAVPFAIAYEPVISSDGTLVSLTFDEESLEFDVVLTEGENAKTLKVEVDFEDEVLGTYNVEEGTLDFSMTSKNVSVSTEEDKEEKTNFTPTMIKINLNQCKVSHL